MDVVAHVSVELPVLLVIPAVGVDTSSVIVTLELEVHPLDAVTVTLYVPSLVKLCEAFVPKLLSHEYVPPPVAVTEIAV